jgi:hypothetical protein
MREGETKGEGSLEEKVREMVAGGRNAAIALRKMILRLQPYVTPTTKPLALLTTTLDIF